MFSVQLPHVMIIATVGIVGLCILMPAAEASTFANCLQGCGACVDFFGKDLYDGHKCAITCKASGGRSVDQGCGNEMFHLIKKADKDMLSCKKYCGMCVLRWSKQVYDGMRCVRSCHLTRGLSIDTSCEMHGHSRKNEVLWDLKRAYADEFQA